MLLEDAFKNKYMNLTVYLFSFAGRDVIKEAPKAMTFGMIIHYAST
jgi:hypothetical protein